MNITFEKIDDLNGKIVAQVEEADYASKVDAELRRIGQTQNIPGFRKGHVALPQLRQRFGKQVKSDVLNRMVYEAVADYINDNNIDILGQPLAAEIKEINLNDKDYTFEYEVGLAPVIDIKTDKDVKLPYKGVEVTDEMLDEEDKSLRERFGAQVPGDEVDEKALVKGSIMQLNEDGSVNTAEDAIQVTNGILAPMYLKDKEEADKFIGRKVGDKVVFNPWKATDGNVAEIASMLNIDKEKAANVKGDFEMNIGEIIVVKPAEHDQEFFDQIFGRDKVHNEEEFRQALKMGMINQFKPTTDYFSNLELRQYLTDTYGEMALPKEFLKKWLKAVNEEKIDDNTDMEVVYEEVLPSFKWELIKGALAKKLDVKVTEDDLLARTKFIAQQQYRQYGLFNVDEATLEKSAKQILQDKDARRRIYDELFEIKMFAMLRDAITMEEQLMSLEDFQKYAAEMNKAQQPEVEEEVVEETAE